MKILAFEQERPSAVQTTQATLRAEAERVWQLQQENTIREIYFRADRLTAVLVLECDSVTEAEQLLATMPLVQAGAITFDLVPLRPYDGLARLFAQSHQPKLFKEEP
jgi:muconolactone delta-isomerase